MPPVANNAQATRAILLASAMATTLNGRRASRTMLHGETPLDRANHRVQRLELSCQYDQARTGINGQTFIALVRNDRQQLLEPLASLCSHNTELSQMRPQRIDHLGPLPQQKIARPVLHQPALLLGRLHPHKYAGSARLRN